MWKIASLWLQVADEAIEKDKEAKVVLIVLKRVNVGTRWQNNFLYSMELEMDKKEYNSMKKKLCSHGFEDRAN